MIASTWIYSGLSASGRICHTVVLPVATSLRRHGFAIVSAYSDIFTARQPARGRSYPPCKATRSGSSDAPGDPLRKFDGGFGIFRGRHDNVSLLVLRGRLMRRQLGLENGDTGL